MTLPAHTERGFMPLPDARCPARRLGVARVGQFPTPLGKSARPRSGKVHVTWAPLFFRRAAASLSAMWGFSYFPRALRSFVCRTPSGKLGRARGRRGRVGSSPSRRFAIALHSTFIRARIREVWITTSAKTQHPSRGRVRMSLLTKTKPS